MNTVLGDIRFLTACLEQVTGVVLPEHGQAQLVLGDDVPLTSLQALDLLALLDDAGARLPSDIFFSILTIGDLQDAVRAAACASDVEDSAQLPALGEE